MADALAEFRKTQISLEKKELQECMSFSSPPPLCGMVFDALMVVLGKKTGWDEVRKEKANLLKLIIEFDVNSVTPQRFDALKKYTASKEFNVDAMKKVSSAAAKLTGMLLGVAAYCEHKRATKAKKAALAQANAEAKK